MQYSRETECTNVSFVQFADIKNAVTLLHHAHFTKLEVVSPPMASMNPTFCAIAHPAGDIQNCTADDLIDIGTPVIPADAAAGTPEIPAVSANLVDLFEFAPRHIIDSTGLVLKWIDRCMRQHRCMR